MQQWMLDMDFVLGILVKFVGLLVLLGIIYALLRGYRSFYLAPPEPLAGSGNGFIKGLTFVRKLLFGCSCDKPPASNY